MNCRKTYHDDGVEIELTGVVTSEDLLSLSAEMYNHPNMEHFRYQLWHMDGVDDLLISAQQMREVARQDMETAVAFPRMKVAIVSNSSLVYGMGRMYEAFCDGSGWETMVFHDLDEARRWIAERNYV